MILLGIRYFIEPQESGHYSAREGANDKPVADDMTVIEFMGACSFAN